MKVVMIAHWTYHQIFLVIIAIINIYHSFIHHTLSSVSVHPCSLTNSICEQNESSEREQIPPEVLGHGMN